MTSISSKTAGTLQCRYPNNCDCCAANAETHAAALAEIERLKERIKQMNKDLAQEQREMQREMRDVPAEARWEARQGDDYVSY